MTRDLTSPASDANRRGSQLCIAFKADKKYPSDTVTGCEVYSGFLERNFMNKCVRTSVLAGPTGVMSTTEKTDLLNIH